MMDDNERQQHIAMSKHKIVEQALQCARLEAFGSYLDDEGNIMRIHSSEVEYHVKVHEDNIKFEAKFLLELMSRLV